MHVNFDPSGSDYTMGDRFISSPRIPSTVSFGPGIDLLVSSDRFRVTESHVTPALLDSFATTPPDDACLLGAPLSAGNALEVALEKRCSELSLRRLSIIML